MIGLLMPVLGTGCLLLIAGLAGLFAFETISSPLPALPILEAHASAQNSEPKAVHQSRRVRSDKYYASVTERPLFAPTRRPVDVVKAEDQDPEPEITPVAEPALSEALQEPPQLKLHGTMIAADGFSALLSTSEDEPEWLSMGSRIQGWKLSEVGDGWATLQNGGETFKLEMH